MDPKFFSPEEATRTLPLVKQIVFDIQRVYQKQNQKNAHLSKSDQISKKKEELHKEFSQLVTELESVGAYLEDPEEGIVDFYGIRGDEIVWLCWKIDEEKVFHWHGLTERFSERKKIIEWPDNQLNSSSTP